MTNKFFTSILESKLQTPEIEKFIVNLTSKTLEDVQEEPIRLNEKVKRIEVEMQEFVLSNYKPIITAHKTISETHIRIGNIIQHLNNIERTLPRINHLYELKYSENYKKASSQYDKINELFNLPIQYTEKIRLSDYEGALNIIKIGKKLKKSKSKKLKKISKKFLNKKLLIKKLYKGISFKIKFPQLLTIIRHLRKLLEENEIKKMYLKASTEYQRKSIINLKRTNPSMLRYIEEFKVNITNVISQYRSMFQCLDNYLNEWVILEVSNLIDSIQIPLNNESEHIIEELMHLGYTSGRLHTDFRILLIPLIEKNIIEQFKISFNKLHEVKEEDEEVIEKNFLEIKKLKNLLYPSIENIIKPLIPDIEGYSKRELFKKLFY